MKSRPVAVRGIQLIVGLVFLTLTLTVVAILTPPERSYKFVTEDHPVDRWDDGSDRWAYFSIGNGSTARLASAVRTELAPRGFTEDASMRPWYRFVKGKEEVVVCNHSEFYVNGGLGHGKLGIQKTPMHSGAWPCILVKNGPGTSGNVGLFQIKKLIYRW